MLNDVKYITKAAIIINGPNGTSLSFFEKKLRSANGIAKQLAKNISKKELTSTAYVEKSLKTIGLITLSIVPIKNIILTSPPPKASSFIILLPKTIIKYIIANIKKP